MRQIITDADAIEAGISKELFQDWIDVMQALWECAIVTYKIMGNKVLPKQGENEILIGSKFKIVSKFVNSSYIETELLNGETQLLEVRYCGNVNTICKIVFVMIKDNA